MKKRYNISSAKCDCGRLFWERNVEVFGTPTFFYPDIMCAWCEKAYYSLNDYIVPEKMTKLDVQELMLEEYRTGNEKEKIGIMAKLLGRKE